VASRKKQNKSVLARARRLAAALRPTAKTESDRLAICRAILRGKSDDERLQSLIDDLAALDADDRHYWIGTFYTLLLSGEQRRVQAAYFTPPHLSKAIIELLRQNGFDPKKHSVLDPAAGGAAFLSTVAAEMSAAGVRAKTIVSRLRGIEIDSALAALSEALIADRTGAVVKASSIVTRADALRYKPRKRYDIVVANPPYGRLGLDDLDDDEWQAVCHPGHINKYALFAKRAFDLAKRGGLVALVLPSSFVAGPLYNRFREFVRSKGQVLLIGSVTNRDDVFVDVAQDICVLLARVGKAHEPSAKVTYGEFSVQRAYSARTTFTLPAKSTAAWSLPLSKHGLTRGGATLEDYGVTIRAGYFVWNRERERMKTAKGRKNDVPLIWAKNVRPGKLCRPHARKRAGIDYVRFDDDAPAIVRTPAIVIQRTTNSSQARRLVAARVAPEVLAKWGGFTSENHTIVVTARVAAALPMICKLLNSQPVDQRYRQLSGTASVSVTLLRTLDLPRPDVLRRARRRERNFDRAVALAYAESKRTAKVA
jgi:adenine-specific DNA-methyltransferase